jgi:hypothetical protein
VFRQKKEQEQSLPEHRLRGEAHTYFPAAACAKCVTSSTAAVGGEKLSCNQPDDCLTGYAATFVQPALPRTISTAFLKPLRQIRMRQAQPAVALCRCPAFPALFALDLVRKTG